MSPIQELVYFLAKESWVGLSFLTKKIRQHVLFVLQIERQPGSPLKMCWQNSYGDLLSVFSGYSNSRKAVLGVLVAYPPLPPLQTPNGLFLLLYLCVNTRFCRCGWCFLQQLLPSAPWSPALSTVFLFLPPPIIFLYFHFSLLPVCSLFISSFSFTGLEEGRLG